MTIVGCTGHQNIPEEAIPYVRDAIRSELRRLNAVALTGVCSLAAGADQMFAQAVLDSGGQLDVIIPSSDYEKTFDSQGAAQYRRLLSRATTSQTLKWPEPSEDAFLDAGQHVADSADVLIAVWDGHEARGKGGTADIVRYAKQHGKRTIVIWPEGIDR
jgi:hypothetical protein